MIYKHLKSGGLYKFLTHALIEADLTHAVVYESLETGQVWVRPESEFFNGRFEELVEELEEESE